MIKKNNNLISIQVLNWDEYQTRKDLKTMSWFRLESNLPEHEAFFNLSNDGKWFFIYLLCLCAKKSTGNIKVKLDYLEHYSQVKKDTIIKALDIMNEFDLIRYELVTDSLPTNKHTNKQTYIQTEHEHERILVNFGLLENVKLKKEENEKLINLFGEKKAEEKIDSLSAYIGSKGDKYKSHYATILNWNKEEIKEIKQKKEQPVIEKKEPEIMEL